MTRSATPTVTASQLQVGMTVTRQGKRYAGQEFTVTAVERGSWVRATGTDANGHEYRTAGGAATKFSVA